MRPLYKIILIFILSFNVCAQSDIPTQRKNAEELRKEYAKHIEQGNYSQIQLDFRINDFYFVLSKYEQNLMALLQHEFSLFIKLTLRNERDEINYDDLRVSENPYAFTNYSKTKLRDDLKRHFFKRMDEIKAALNTSSISSASKDYIHFYINKHDFYRDYGNNEKQLALVRQALDYVNKYPIVPLAKIVNKKHSKYSEPRAFAVDFNGGLSFGFYESELGSRLNKIWGFDMEMRFYLHNTFIGGRGHVTFNKTKKEFVGNNYLFEENRRGIAMTYIDLYVGRNFYLNKRISILPHVGYSITEFSVFQGGDPAIEENWEWTYTQGMMYGIDLQYDFDDKIIQKTLFARHKRKLSFGGTYLRLSSVMRNPNLIEIDPVFKGNSFTFSLGLGAHLRGSKRYNLPAKML